jgi:DNA repair protein RecO (recombination protein O)
MRRVQLEPAFVLSLRPYRETSALVEVFTQRHGRTGLVARGVQSGRARLRGLLQPFQRLLLSFSERGELGTLTGAEPDGTPAALRGEAVFSGWYLNELLLRLLPRGEPHADLFDHYAEALAALSVTVAARQALPAAAPTLRLFEKRLLAGLGYGLELPDPVEDDRWYDWDAERGLRLAEPGPSSYSGASLRALADDALDTDESLRDARRLMRDALRPHLGDRALRTPEMLRTLRAGVRGEGLGDREKK